jgi:phenylalanyl-tRNA synthetase beta chain
VYTYSMVSEAVALESGFKLEDHLKLQNPLTDDRVYLRRSLMPSLTEVIAQNVQRSELNVFELAHTFEPREGELPGQELHVTLATTHSYRELRGIVDAIADRLFVTFAVQPNETPQTGWLQSATVHCQDVELGTIGVVSSGVVGADLSLAQLIEVAKTHPTYQPIPKTAIILEDLTFTLPSTVAVGNVIQSIQKSSPLIIQVELLDQYNANFTFRVTYHDPERNLGNEDVEPIRRQVVSTICDEYQAELVGQVA